MHYVFTCVCVSLCRVFIPNYISKVKVQLVNCSTKNKSSDSCPVVLKIRPRAPPVHNSSAFDCREWNLCELETVVPAWEQWYYILVERYLSTSDVYFRISVQVTGERFYLLFICWKIKQQCTVVEITLCPGLLSVFYLEKVWFTFTSKRYTVVSRNFSTAGQKN